MSSKAKSAWRSVHAYRLDGEQLLGGPRTTHGIDMVVQFSNADIPQIVREFQTDFFIHEPSVRSADVILSKLRWNRAFPSDRQLQDIAGIVATQQGQLDLGYLRKWAGQIAEASLIEDVLSGKIKLKET